MIPADLTTKNAPTYSRLWYKRRVPRQKAQKILKNSQLNNFIFERVKFKQFIISITTVKLELRLVVPFSHFEGNNNQHLLVSST